MSSNLFKKVRIVHSPLEQRYLVEQKSIWSFRWVRVDVFEYVDVPSPSPFGCHDKIDAALEKAKKRAEILLARTVVWEQTNYFWY